MKIHWLAGLVNRLQFSRADIRNNRKRRRRFRLEQRCNPSIAVGELLEVRVLLSGTPAVNQAPTNITLSSASVAENKSAGTVVGTFSTTDPDVNNTFTYSLVSGAGSTDNGRFAIVGGTLTTVSVFDFEQQSSASIRIRSTDQGGLFTEKTFTIGITNVNEAPTDIRLSATSVTEFLPAATVVGTLSTTDSDAGNTFSYSLVTGTGSTDNSNFSISGNALKTTASFNAATKASYNIRIRSTDQGGLTYEEPFTISVSKSAAVPLIDAGGLEFRSDTQFTRSGTNGSIYSSTGVTYVGFVPAVGASFVRLLELDGSASVDTSAITFSASGAIKEAIVSPAVTLVAGGLSSTRISDVLNGKLTGLAGSTITAAGRNFTLTSLSLNATGDNGNPAVLLQGAIALPGGLNLSVNGSNRVIISSQAIRLTGVSASLSTSFTLGSMTFDASKLTASYSNSAGNNAFIVTGTSSATIPGLGTLSLNLGDPTVGSAGFVVTNSSIALDASASTTGLGLAGAVLSATGLRITYASATGGRPEQFTLSGTANLNYGTGNNLTLAMPATSGLVITNNFLSSLNATAVFATGTKIAGVSFSNTSLSLAYAAASGLVAAQLRLNGTTSLTFAKTQTLTLGLGDSESPGMLISGGSLQAFNGTVVANSPVTLGTMSFTLNRTSVGYTAATATAAAVLTVSGDASVSASGVNGGSSFNVRMGSSATTQTVNGVTSTIPATNGLVIANGVIQSLDMSVTSNLTAGGLTFTTKGLRMTENTSTGVLTVTGNTTFSDSQLGTIAVNFGGTTASYLSSNGTAKPSITTAGLALKNNSLISLDMTVTSNIHAGGVTFTTAGMRFTDVVATGVFTMTGAATFTESNLGTVSVNFGDSNSKGLVETNGVLTSLDLTVNSNLTIAGVTMTTKGLHMVYAAGTGTSPDMFSVTGKTSVTTADGNLSIAATFGSSGLVITGGHLTSLDMTVNSTFMAGNMKFTTKSLEFIYTSANQLFTLTGTASVQMPSMDAAASVTFGSATDPGLVVQNGKLKDFDIAVTSGFKTGGVQFTTKNLTITYTSVGSVFTLSGTAAVSMPSLGSVAVSLGQEAANGTVLSRGLVIQNGAFVSFDMTINTDTKVGSVLIHTKDLEFAYFSDTKTFTMSGTAGIDMPSMGTVSVTLGTYDSNHNIVKQGLVVTNGKFVSMDMTVNADFKIGSIQVYSENLSFDYVDSTKTFTMSGTAGVNMPSLGRVEVTMGTYSGEKATGTLLKPGLVVTNNKLINLDMTVNTDIRVGGGQLFTHNLNFDYVAATDTFTMTGTAGIVLSSYGAIAVTLGQQDSQGHTLSTGLVIRNGSFVSLNMTVNSVFNVDGAIFTTRNLNFTYVQATDTFTMQGTASVAIVGALSSLQVTLGQVAADGTVIAPGLVIVGGKFQSIDMTVNSTFNVDAVVFTTRNLHMHYSEIVANGYPARTFTMTGTASVAVPLLTSVDVTFGGNGTQGLVVTDNVLQVLNMSIDADVLGFAGYSLASADLQFSYSANSHLFIMSGTAEIGLPELGGVKITLGGNGTQGLVINTQNNVVQSFDMSAAADFSIAGLKFGQARLVLSYTDTNHQFIVSGSANLNLKLETFTAQLGGSINGHTSQGLVIQNGKLVMMDFVISGSLGLPDLSLGSSSLYVNYDGTTHTFDFQGTADATLSTHLPSWVTTYFGLPSGSFHVGTVNIGIHLEQGGTQTAPEQDAGSSSANVGGAVDPNFDLPWTYGIDTGVTSASAVPGSGGTEVKFLRNSGTLSNTASSYTDGTSYEITFAAAQQSSTVNQTFGVTVDGVSVGVFTPPTTTYQSFSTTVFTPGHGSHTIAFSGMIDGATAYLGNVAINQTASPASLTTSLSNPTPFANALSFNGTSQSVQLPSHGFADFTNGFSAGMWVYPTSVGNYQRLFDFGNGPGSDNIILARNGLSNDLTFIVYNGSTATGVSASNALQLNTWQYLSVVMQAPAPGATTTLATIYTNGSPIATGTVFVPANLNRTLNYVGRSNWSSDALFAGQMNDFSLWNAPLSAAQMQSAPTSVYSGTEAGLIGYWPMNDTTRGTVFDRGPGGLSGGSSAFNGTTTATSVTVSTGSALPNLSTSPPLTSAMSFDGATGTVQLPETGFDNFTTGFSAGVWVYPTSTTSGTTFFDLGNGSNNNNLRLSRSSTTGDLTFTETSAVRSGLLSSVRTETVTASKAIELNKWQYFSVVMQSNGSTTLYKNGNVIATGAVSVPSTARRDSNFIGKSNVAGSPLYPGKMAGLSIWTTALTQSQIQAGMTSGQTGAEPGLVGYWPLGGSAAVPVAVSVTDSTFANAMSFDGVTTSLSLSSNNLSNFTTGFSAGVWVYPTAITNNAPIFVLGQDGTSFIPGSSIRLGRSGTSDDLVFSVKNSSGFGSSSRTTVTAANALEINKWQYFSVVMQPDGTTTLSKNGLVIATGTVSIPNIAARTDNQVGNSSNRNDDPFAGQMAALSLWNIPLTTSQVQAAANTAFSGTETGLVNYQAMGFDPPTLSTASSGSVHGFSAATAQSFDGATQSIQIPTTGLSDFSNGLSAGVWVYPTAANSNSPLFELGNSDTFSITTGAGSNQVVTYNNDILLKRDGNSNDLTFSILDGRLVTSVTASDVIRLNQWQYFSVVMQPDGSTTLYKNGVAIATGQVATPAQVDRSQNYIGQTNGLNPIYFEGQMMGFSLWNTPLNNSQVLDGMTTSYTGNESGLVGYWRMDGSPAANVSDLSSHQRNGLAEGGVSYSLLTSGYNTPYAGSLTFDGTTTAVQLPSSGFSNFTNGFSSGMWVYPTDDGNNTSFFNFGNGLASDNLLLKRNGTSNDLAFQVYNGKVASTLVAANAIQNNVWQYFSVVLQPTASGATTTTATIYRNGIAIATGTVNAPRNVARASDFVGRSLSPFDSPFSGQMNSLSLWNTAQTTAQVKAGMTSAYAGTISGMIGFWPMNETAGSTVVDHSTNRMNGTVSSGVISQTTNTNPRSANLDFESPQLADGQFVYSPANAGWTFTNGSTSSRSGITANDSSLLTVLDKGTTTALNGSQAGFLQGDSSMSTVLTGFSANSFYDLSFYAAPSQLNSATQSVQVFMDGNLLGTYTPAATFAAVTRFANAYSLFTIPIGIIGSGLHSLTFKGTNSNPSNTILIDAVTFTTMVPTAVPPSITYPVPQFSDASFENQPSGWTSSGQQYFYQPSGSGIPWSFTTGAGITQHGYGLDNGGKNVDNGDSPPDGSWEGFLQGGNASMSQTISGFAPGQFYDLSFFTKERTGYGYGAGARNSVIVSMDGVVLGTYESTTGLQWQQILVRGISPGLGSHTFTLTSTGSGSADVTSLIDQIQFFNSGLDTISAVNPVPSITGGSHNSYAAFTINVSGIDVGVQVFFDGRVNLIYGDVLSQEFTRMAQDLTKAYKATASALAGAAVTIANGASNVANLTADTFEAGENAVADAAKSATKAVQNGLKKVGRALKHFFNYYVDDATVYYDSSTDFVTQGMATGDSSITDAEGGFQLELPENPTTGQLVGYGGIDTATGLPNDATFTAVPTSQVLSPLTTLVNTLVVTRDLSEEDAITTIDVGLGLSSAMNADGIRVPYNVDERGTMDRALAGDSAAAMAFAGEAKVYLLAHEIASLLVGLPDNTCSMTVLMSYGFRALAEAVFDHVGNQASALDLSDPNVVQVLIQSTAGAAGIQLDQRVSSKGGTLIARFEGAIDELSRVAATAPGTLLFLQRTAAYQRLADGTMGPMLTTAANGSSGSPNRIDDLLISYTTPQVKTEAVDITIGNLTPPVVSIDPNVNVHDSTGANQANYLEFQVAISGTASPLLPISIRYMTIDGSATAASGDYTPVQGTLVWNTIDPVTHLIDTSAKTIRVPIAPGTSLAASKQFLLQLFGEQNALLTYSTAVGTIDKAIFDTTTTLQTTLESTPENSFLVLTAFVSNQDSIYSAATGSVTFFDGSTVLGTVNLDLHGTAILSLILDSGSHSITARYNGRVVVGGVYNQSTSLVSSVNLSQEFDLGPSFDESDGN